MSVSGIRANAIKACRAYCPATQSTACPSTVSVGSGPPVEKVMTILVSVLFRLRSTMPGSSSMR